MGGGPKAAATNEHEFLPIVDLTPAGPGKTDDVVARITAAQALPGFDQAQRLIVEAMACEAQRLTLETAAESTVWLDVDGVRRKPLRAETSDGADGRFKEAAPLSRDSGMAVAQVLRTLGGLSDSGGQQAGEFEFVVDRTPFLGRLAAARSTAGERVVVQFVPKKHRLTTLADAGLPAPLVDQLAQVVDRDAGLLLLSAPPGQGLTTTVDLLVEASDRFLRDFVSIVDRDRPSREIVNLAALPYGRRDDPAPADLLKSAIHKNVGVIVAPDVRDQDFVVELVKVAATKAMVVMTIKAADAVEAVRRVMKCGVEPKVLGSALRGSLSQRLVRRLCPRCRVQVDVPAPLRSRFQRLGVPVEHLFDAAGQGCLLCRGLGYRGRIGIFEFAAGDSFRRTVAAGGGSDQLRESALKEGMGSLRDAGLRLVAAGTTSLEEIERVLAPSPGEAKVRHGCSS